MANYRDVRGRFLEFSDGPRYQPKGTRTTGPTPVDADVQPLVPAPDLGPQLAPLTANPTPQRPR